MSIWLIFLLGGLLTFGIRFSFLLFPGQVERSQTLRRALAYVPIAILTALIVSDVLMREGGLDVSISNERLIASLAAVLVAWRTRNILLTIAVGMGVLVVMGWMG